jgi:hypothetical protein
MGRTLSSVASFLAASVRCDAWTAQIRKFQFPVGARWWKAKTRKSSFVNNRCGLVQFARISFAIAASTAFVKMRQCPAQSVWSGVQLRSSARFVFHRPRVLSGTLNRLER